MEQESRYWLRAGQKLRRQTVSAMMAVVLSNVAMLSIDCSVPESGSWKLGSGQIFGGKAAYAQSPQDIAIKANQRAGVTDSEILIGSCAPLSGQMKERGAQVVAGGRAYFSYVNEQGGVNGRKLNLLSYDDKYEPSTAIEVFNKNLRGKVFMGTLFQGTAAAAKYVQLSDATHMPMVGFSTGAEFIINPVHPYAFQVRASYFNEAAAQIEMLYDKLGMKRIVVVYQNDAYGAACREGVEKGLAKFGAKPAAEVSFPRLSRDLDPVVSKIAEAKPDAVILGAGGDALSLIVKERAKFGNNVRLVAFSVGTDLLIKEAAQDANETIITQVAPLTQSNLPAVQQYIKLLAKYEHSTPSMSGFEGFLIAMAVVEGLKRAGKDLTRDSFVSAMESIHNFDLHAGPKFMLNFSKDMHDGMRSGVYWTMIKDGKLINLTDWKTLKK